jgi:hypothetical protein
MTSSQNLNLLPASWAVCRLPAEASIPEWAHSDDLLAFIRTRDELTVVCSDERIPLEVTVEHGWRVLEVQGPLDFSLVGILASVAVPLADAGISIFTLSTYDTDYILVRNSDLELSILTLQRAGHKVHHIN